MKAFYAQSGGVTAVINSTAAGLIEAAHKQGIGVLAGRNGILGALREELIDTQRESATAIHQLYYTPGAAFGSCRYKLPDDLTSPVFKRLLEVFAAHQISYFFYNGGGDSQDTTHKISRASKILGYPLCCIGLPKTIDNDLEATDSCPGFGSAAKYIATSVREIDYDLRSMATSPSATKVFILETMGRHTGWLAAAGGLASENHNDTPYLIIFPERLFSSEQLLEQVSRCVARWNRCIIIAAEGTALDKIAQPNDHDNHSHEKDPFGHPQRRGHIAPRLAQLIKEKLGYNYHWAVADYLQRSARHLASKVDLQQAYQMGNDAMRLALEGKNDVMTTIVRLSHQPYQWETGWTELGQVANSLKRVPESFISRDGFHITPACREYLLPLIQGEDPPPYKEGLPAFIDLQNHLVQPLLQPWQL